MNAGQFDVFAGQLVEQIEIICTLVVYEHFVLLTDIQFLIIVNGIHVVFQQSFEALRGQVELCHTACAKQEHLSVAVAGDAQHRIAEQTIRVVFFSV